MGGSGREACECGLQSKGTKGGVQMHFAANDCDVLECKAVQSEKLSAACRLIGTCDAVIGGAE